VGVEDGRRSSNTDVTACGVQFLARSREDFQLAKVIEMEEGRRLKGHAADHESAQGRKVLFVLWLAMNDPASPEEAGR